MYFWLYTPVFGYTLIKRYFSIPKYPSLLEYTRPHQSYESSSPDTRPGDFVFCRLFTVLLTPRFREPTLTSTILPQVTRILPRKYRDLSLAIVVPPFTSNSRRLLSQFTIYGQTLQLDIITGGFGVRIPRPCHLRKTLPR